LLIQAVLLEEFVQGDARNLNGESAVDEGEQVGAGGVRVGVQEAGDGAGEARQELAVRSALEAVVCLLDDLLGGEGLLLRGGGAADADKAGDLRDLNSTALRRDI